MTRITQVKTVKNNPERKGEPASKAVLFSGSRYKFQQIHSRFDENQFFVWDAEKPDDNGKPSLIRQFFNVGELMSFIDSCEG